MSDRPALAPRRRVPVILQHEQSECGLACLSMILSSFGHECSLQDLRRMSGSCGGAALDGLLQLAGQLGLIARPVRLPLAEIGHLATPAILHWRMNHFVVLVRAQRRRVLIHDPALGKQWVTFDEFDRSFTGIAMELRRAPDFRRRSSAPEPGLRDLIRGARNVRRYIVTVLVLVLAGQLLALTPAVVTQLLIDEVILGQAAHWLTAALAGMFAVLLSAVLIDAIRKWISLYSGAKLAMDSTCNLVAHLLRLPIAFIRERHLGDIMSKLDSLSPIRQAITEQSVDALANAVMLAVTLTVMLIYSTELALVSVVGITLTFLLLALTLPKMSQLNNRLLIQRASEKSSLLESFRGFETVRSLGMSEVRSCHWQNRFFAATDTAYRLGRFDIARSSLLSVVSGAEQTAFLAVGIGGAINHELSVGVLFAFMSMRSRCTTAAMRLVEGLQSFALLRVHARRLGDLAYSNTEEPVPRGAVSRSLIGKLEVRGLQFGFPGGRRLIHDLDCNFPAGTHTVITGASGCGKTTLLRLLNGQLVPRSGSVLVDGIELSLWDREAYVRQIGVVLQNESLFQGTIADNIAGFSAHPDLACIRKAAVAAGIWDDIQQLPMKLETLLGDTGTNLSGGQVQRIAIARAIYRQPKILFLDEATSHLDTASEAQVLANIGKLKMTIVSIAHRPGAIAGAGQVIRLDVSASAS